MLTVITKNYVVRNTTFAIVKKDDHFLAINRKYITDGKLNTPLNGLQMFASDNLNHTLELAKNQVEIDYLISCGFSLMEAMTKVYNCNINF